MFIQDSVSRIMSRAPVVDETVPRTHGGWSRRRSAGPLGASGLLGPHHQPRAGGAGAGLGTCERSHRAQRARVASPWMFETTVNNLRIMAETFSESDDRRHMERLLRQLTPEVASR